MSHPLSDEAIAHIEKSWGMVRKFGLQEAGIVMFKRSVIQSVNNIIINYYVANIPMNIFSCLDMCYDVFECCKVMVSATIACLHTLFIPLC